MYSRKINLEQPIFSLSGAWAVGNAAKSKKAPPWGELPPEAAEGGTTSSEETGSIPLTLGFESVK